MPDIGNIAKSEAYNLTDKTDKYAIIIKCNAITRKVMVSCKHVIGVSRQVRESKEAFWRK
jgi:hypothetical protein